MVEMGGSEQLAAARRSLKASLEKTKSLGAALERAGPRLDEIHQRLPSLEASVRPIRADKEALVAVGGHIDRAVWPAAAVLKVFDAVHGLEKSLLSDPGNDLWSYLTVLKQLEDACRFLSDNCGLAIQWLDDIVEYLEENFVADSRYLNSLKKDLEVLRGFQDGGGRVGLDGGLFIAALDKLEAEFRLLLSKNSSVLPMSSKTSTSDSDGIDHPRIAPSPLPVSVINKMQLIMERLAANGRFEKCLSIYVELRTLNIKVSLQALNLEYLDLSSSDFGDVQSIEGHIVQWGEHLEFAVKHLFEAEYNLCRDVFEKMGTNLWVGFFAKIASQAGILSFLRFGKTVTESKKDPIKMLKLLDMFASLNNLRLDFNRLFGGKECIEIQNMTRDLIKAVIEGASEIFWELLVQVEFQRQAPPPPNGSVPRLVSFISDFCNRLLGDDYKPVLTQVLVIHRSWKLERFQERILIDEIFKIMKAVELNVDTWSKAYEDNTLSILFLTNNHWHFYKYLKGTKLGELLGDAWIKEREHDKEHYVSLYLRESWGKLSPILSREGLLLFSAGRATARDLVKKMLKAFNEAFEEMYKKHSQWLISDKELREKVCQLAMQAILPVFRSFMQNYGPLVEQDASASKYVKYSVQSLENMLSSLFMLKLMKYASAKVMHSNGNPTNGMSSQFRSISSLR